MISILIKAIGKHPKFLTQTPIAAIASTHSNKQQKGKAMSPFASCLLLLLSSLALVSLARAQDRAPHGIAYENPMAFSPSAYEFFHPKTREPDTQNPCAASNCSPLPMAAQVDTAKALEESKVSTQQISGHRLGAGGIAGVVFGLAFAVLLAMGAYYVLTTRRANANRANSVQPDA
ncbi:Uncharacterized protein TCM_042052 [Theobroma cacao]|uniref:Transmembrane protein n=2 Tax=Theobroma cacao TaxID=3641 RepID=A0A061GY53_THECC|nr:Uncharacterized protein TCM_042052 [Theobroma cacao]